MAESDGHVTDGIALTLISDNKGAKMNDEKHRKSGWKTVTYGDKKLLEWYSDYLQRKMDGTSNDWSDIICTFKCLADDDTIQMSDQNDTKSASEPNFGD